MNEPRNGLTRRNILGGLGAGAGIIGLTSVTPAGAVSLPEPETSLDVDVVVIGTGMAGTAAALEAVSAGRSVAVVEKMAENRAGGNSALAGGGFAIPRSDGIADRDQYVSDFVQKGSGRGNRELYELLAGNARADLGWLREHGVEFLPETASSLYAGVSTTVVAPGMYIGMPRTLQHLRDRIREAGGQFFFETKAKQLLFDEKGAVAGLRSLGPGGLVDINALAVVIAMGGYAGNPELLEDFSDPNAGALMVRGVQWATGDGLDLARQAGAGLRGMGGLMALHIAAVDPMETAAGNPSSTLPYCLGINRDGKRYIDESLGYVAHGKAALAQPGQRVSLIFDENIRGLPGAMTAIDTFGRLGIPIVEADNLEELASAIEVPADALAQTVAAFNAAVEGTAAPGATPPKQKTAYRIEGPKFYAFHPLVPGVTLTFGGIRIDRQARVLEPDGRVIAGLYAAGEGAGHLFFDDYVGGGALAQSLVIGRIAGQQAAARASA